MSIRRATEEEMDFIEHIGTALAEALNEILDSTGDIQAARIWELTAAGVTHFLVENFPAEPGCEEDMVKTLADMYRFRLERRWGS